MAKERGKGRLREATVAGIFYPEDPRELEAEVDRLLAQDLPPTFGDDLPPTQAILAPHASFHYSGDLAGLAWRSLRGRPVSRAVVLSPLHRAAEPGLYLCDSEIFETPLGPVEVDLPGLEEVLDCGTAFVRNDIPHFEEHGVEMQLPFLRRLYPAAKVLPILVALAGQSLVRTLAAALGQVFGPDPETLFVISSDLAAGYQEDQTAHHADSLIAEVAEGAWETLLRDPPPGLQGPCGGPCLAAYLASPPGRGTEAHVLGRHDSQAVRVSPQERLVQYAALAFVGLPGGRP